MEDIQIISSNIDEYKEHFKDEDYKNTMNALMRIHNIKQINAPENYYLERQDILSNSRCYDFRRIAKGLFIYDDAAKYVFSSYDISKCFLYKLFIITGNDNDIINSMTLQINLQINKKELDKLLKNIDGVKQVLSKDKKCYRYSGIKAR